MSRHIDADKLRKDEIARCHCVPCVGSNDSNYKDLDEVLNDAPTSDVVKVVRCKDCKHSREYTEWVGTTSDATEKGLKVCNLMETIIAGTEKGEQNDDRKTNTEIQVCL